MVVTTTTTMMGLDIVVMVIETAQNGVDTATMEGINLGAIIIDGDIIDIERNKQVGNTKYLVIEIAQPPKFSLTHVKGT